MSDCPICKAISDKNLTLYEDDEICAMLYDEPAAAGHIIIAPKHHYPIIEAVPDPLIKKMWASANKISIAIFEAAGAHGTNFIIQNGLPAGQSKPHVILHVIPRREGDGNNFEWQPGGISEEETSKAESLIKDGASNIGKAEKEKPKPIEEKKPETPAISDTDYRIKALRRMP